MNHEKQPKTIVIYREEHTKTWCRVPDVYDLQTEMTLYEGLSIVFKCETFGHLRGGGFLGEIIIIRCHNHATDVRYAAKVIFEYLVNQNHTWVRANVRKAELPVIPVEWKNLVLAQHHMLHYTGEALNINPFLALVSHNDLTFEASRVLGSQTLVPLETTPNKADQTLGRGVASSPVSQVTTNADQPLGRGVASPPVSQVTAPNKSWFNRFFRNA
jgi:hypothetical protein